MEAEILLAHALDVDRLHLYLAPDKPLTADERSRYRAVIQERHSGIPLQYLIGEVTFLGLRFRVNRSALIPRPETEELLDRALRLAPRDRAIRCLDLGTGTGVIAVCLARYLPQAHVTAIDVSSQALELAQRNAAFNGVAERIAFLESNWFGNVTGQFDFIVSNPPYISDEEWTQLPDEVRAHEPRVALDGGSDGLEHIGTLLSGACDHLLPEGTVLLEVGHTQGERVKAMMKQAGLTDVDVEMDLAGKERFLVARCPS